MWRATWLGETDPAKAIALSARATGGATPVAESDTRDDTPPPPDDSLQARLGVWNAIAFDRPAVDYLGQNVDLNQYVDTNWPAGFSPSYAQWAGHAQFANPAEPRTAPQIPWVG
jgi:hypothetical protein